MSMSSCVIVRHSVGPIVFPWRAFSPSIPLTSTVAAIGANTRSTGRTPAGDPRKLLFAWKGYRYGVKRGPSIRMRGLID